MLYFCPTMLRHMIVSFNRLISICALLLCLQNTAVKAQLTFDQGFAPVVTPESAMAGPGQNVNEIAVPIHMQGIGFYAVNGFSFYLNFDASRLQYAGVEAIAVSNVSVSATGNTLSIQWSNPASPVNLTANSLVLKLLFNRITNGDVYMSFLPGSKVSGAQGLIAVNYSNGLILQTWNLSTESLPPAGGSTSGAGVYVPNQQVVVSASVANGYLFERWTYNGNTISTSPSFVFTMPNADANLQAHFTAKTYQVSTQSVPQQGGSTSGAGFYQYGQSVSLNATPAEGYAFQNWTAGGEVVSTQADYTFTMPDGDLSLWANFELIDYQLILEANPESGGTTAGSGFYNFGQNVSAKATPASGYHFVHWSQGAAVVSTEPVYNFAMPASNLTLTAEFLVNTYLITVESSNTAFGEVSGGGGYTHGSSVSVHATPNENYTFVAWTENGQAVSFEAVYTFEATSDRALTAVFQETGDCPPPLNTGLSALDETTALLYWVSPGNINSWELLWGVSDGDSIVGEGFQALTNLSQWFLDALEPQTTYVVFVRALCGEALFSEWSTPFFFSTWYVGQGELTGNANFILFPNPGDGNVSLKGNATDHHVKLITVSDLRGNILFVSRPQNKGIPSLSLAELPNGMYVVSIETEDGSRLLKYIKMTP